MATGHPGGRKTASQRARSSANRAKKSKANARKSTSTAAKAGRAIRKGKGMREGSPQAHLKGRRIQAQRANVRSRAKKR